MQMGISGPGAGKSARNVTTASCLCSNWSEIVMIEGRI